MIVRTAYMPLPTYPEAPSDEAVLAACRFAEALGLAVHVTAFATSIPQMRSPLGGLLLDVPSLVRANEEKSRAECGRLQDMLRQAAGPASNMDVTIRTVVLGAAFSAAASEARAYQLSLIPWSGETVLAQDMAQAVVFESGRPAILMPAAAGTSRLDHVAMAWDGSRVAARALWDALAVLPANGRLTVLTIRDEKPLAYDVSDLLASSLAKRGCNAKASNIALAGRTIAVALQESAIESGAQMLAMGGFGHSRLRDFILGGATKGVLEDLRLPVLLSH